MNIATYELLIPFITNETARRRDRAQRQLQARRSPARWLHAQVLITRTRWLRAS